MQLIPKLQQTKGYDDDALARAMFEYVLAWTGRAVAAIALLVIVFSSVLIVSNNENTVIQRFGKYVRTEGPGPHGKLPWPIESAITVEVTNVHRMEVGFRTVKDGEEKDKPVPGENEMLTGDMNIVEADFVLQYRKSDAAKWLFTAKDPEEALNFLAQGSKRQTVGGHTFDEVATSGRTQVQEEAETLLRNLTRQFDFGATIVNLQLQDAHPPKPVMGAFQDVTNAREDQQKTVRKAESYRNEKIPQAEGEAKRLISESEGYKEKRIADAKGDANRFLAVLEKYRQNPQLTVDRLRFETIEQVLPGKDTVIDRTGVGGSLLKFLNVTGKEKK